MPDPADLAQEAMGDIVIPRSDPGPRLKGNGQCHNCSEPVAPGELFCDNECRADWSGRERSRSMLLGR